LTKSYFVERGVCDEGAKPEKIRLYKQVTLEQCKALFEKAIGEQKKFDYKACKSGKLRAKIEKLWPFFPSKKEMPVNSHVGFEFIIGIVTEEAKPPITVNWALYVEETNKKQRSGVRSHSQKAKWLSRDRCLCSQAPVS
jgi:hypothetical protein